MKLNPDLVSSTSEATFQGMVADLASLLGWSHLHVRRSRSRKDSRTGEDKWATTTNIAGWPDLFLWHPRQARTLAVELKAGKGRATVEQRQVLAELEAAGVETHVWRPSDWDVVESTLRPTP